MIDCIATLIAEVDSENEEHTEVFATLESASQREFFSAAQEGFKADYKLTLWADNYEGQPFVELGENKTRYSVYRRYLRNDNKIELYLSSKAGVFS